jgi:RNA polymerase sigma factor (sigma-70 family)
MADREHNSDTIDDKLCWGKFLAGDNNAFAILYKKYVEVLFSYGMRFTSDRELVKDCIQDVFVKMYNHRFNLHPQDHMKFYLFISIKNTILNALYKSRNIVHIDTVEPLFMVGYIIEDNSAAYEEDEERKEKMESILNSLTSRQREIIYYRYVEGMNLKEIACLMDMNIQSVQNLIQRSIKRVKKVFEEEKSSIIIKYIL